MTSHASKLSALTNNRAYLSYEMRRLQTRCHAFSAARQAGDVKGYFEAIAQLDDEREELIVWRRDLKERGVELGFEALSADLGLSGREEDVLAICIAQHVSPNTRQLLLSLQAKGHLDDLEVGFVSELLEPSTDLLSVAEWAHPAAPLRRSGFVRIGPHAGRESASLLAAVIRPYPCLADAAMGVSRIDTQLQECSRVYSQGIDPMDVVLPARTREAFQDLLASVPSVGEQASSASWTVLLSGPAGVGKTLAAQAIASARGRHLFSLDVGLLATRKDALDLLWLASVNARLMKCDLHLTDIAPLVETTPALAPGILEFFAQHPGPTFVECSSKERLFKVLELSVQSSLHVDLPDVGSREQIWRAELPLALRHEADLELGSLAHAFELTGKQISLAVQAAQRAISEGESMNYGQLERAARAQLNSRMGDFTNASRIELSMDQLVLAEEPMSEVHEFLSACRNHRRLLSRWGFERRLVTGRGLVALFCGEAGTGKTLTAEVLANELGLELHIVSIPKIVSKWVGETEKNVREVFSQARAQNSMLLFDEADSLFAKRVRVEDSNDHYQNMEVNNLLQEIERFDGVVILTTNLETNMDPAFARRILYRIEFPLPRAQERALIWQKLIPQECPTETIDFAYLGETFELSGGQIKNAILRAAYSAIGEGSSVDIEGLSRSASREMSAAGRVVQFFDDGDPYGD